MKIILSFFILLSTILATNLSEDFLTSYYGKKIVKRIDKNPKNYSFILKKELINLIKKPNKIEIDYSKKISFLETRILNNKKNDNFLAIARDKLTIEKYNNRTVFSSLINDLKTSYINYKDKKKIMSILNLYKNNIYNYKNIKYKKEFLKNKNNKNNNKVILSFINEFETTEIEYKYITFLIKYLENNINLITKQNKIMKIFSINDFSKIINNKTYLIEINHYFKYYFKTSIGLFIISLTFFIIINLFYYLFKSSITKIINRFLISENEDIINLKKFLINLFNKSAFFLVFIFSINVFLIIFNYNNTDINENKYFNLIYIIFLIMITYKTLNIVIQYYSDTFFHKYPNVKKEMISFLLKTSKLVLFIIVILIILSKLGFDIKALLASLGVGGIAIALAAKDTLSNLFGSITIMLDNSYGQGDWIKTSTYEGTVVEIRMRTTTIRTFDNALVTIPNSVLANSSIKNYSQRKIGRRIKMKLGVTYESEMKNILKSIEEIKKYLNDSSYIATENTFIDVKSSKLIKKEDEIGVKKTLLVFIDNYNDFSIDILIYCFSKTVNWEEWLKVKENLLIKINEIFVKNNVEFAYPTVKSYFKKV